MNDWIQNIYIKLTHFLSTSNGLSVSLLYITLCWSWRTTIPASPLTLPQSLRSFLLGIHGISVYRENYWKLVTFWSKFRIQLFTIKARSFLLKLVEMCKQSKGIMANKLAYITDRMKGLIDYLVNKIKLSRLATIFLSGSRIFNCCSIKIYSDALCYNIYTKLIPLKGVFIFKDVCRAPYIFVITDLKKILNKYSRSTHFCSVIMHIWISGVTAVMGKIQMQWLHHQWELGVDIGFLRWRVGWFRRM